MRYCVAPATPVQPSLTVLPRVSTTLRLDTLPTGCSSATPQNRDTRIPLEFNPEHLWPINPPQMNWWSVPAEVLTFGYEGDRRVLFPAFEQRVQRDDVFCVGLEACQLMAGSRSRKRQALDTASWKQGNDPRSVHLGSIHLQFLSYATYNGSIYSTAIIGYISVK